MRRPDPNRKSSPEDTHEDSRAAAEETAGEGEADAAEAAAAAGLAEAEAADEAEAEAHTKALWAASDFGRGVMQT